MTAEDAQVRRERGELFFVHSSGCPVCVLCVSRLLFHASPVRDNPCYLKIDRAIARFAHFFHRLRVLWIGCVIASAVVGLSALSPA